ncbi:DUF2977 domain-containing protein [Staphylococcus saprophyticus]|nr:DUF2977 domain-containing protein [Staphylococcus saprophyticus]MDW4448418.1 DUF2977 domain-containing protein [Staphylococcus saprophyticus]
MQILLNQNNEIIAYAVSGSIEREGYVTVTIENNSIPKSFRQSFKPKYFLYKDEEVKLNANYEEEKTELPQVPHIGFTTSDDALRRMFSSMQVQIVQGNKMVNQLTQQNANLSQQIVQLSQEVEKLKGGNSDETTVSEV